MLKLLGCGGLAVLIAAACSATGGTTSPQVVGTEGSGGAGAAGGAGGSTAIDTDSATNPFNVRIEQGGITVTIVTLSCEGPCAEVVAVPTGGRPPYTFEWEDGSTSPARRVCPTADTTYHVSVTDTASSAGEIPQPPRTTSAPLTADVVECPATTDVYWVDWRVLKPDAGAADGTITAPLGEVGVVYAGQVGTNSQLPSGTASFFEPAATYLSPTVTDPPPPRGAVAVSGDAVSTHVITFSVPVKNPVIALWSVGFGSLGLPMEWEFEQPPALLSSGSNAYNLPPNLTVSGRRVRGVEGNGVIELDGTFESIRFTLPVPEPYPGYAVFTVGIRGRG